MKEFAINDYLMLKLKEGLTYIYVYGEPFNQRVYLILNVPVKQVKKIDFKGVHAVYLFLL